VDRDLNYSEPVAVRLTIHPPYRQWTLIGVLCLALVGLTLASGYGIRRRQERDQAREQLMQEMEEELQDARRMQMSLMPTASPEVPGISISGRCLSANHVGGDFFQYFVRDGEITISLADVTGHAMEAAIPAVMFSGILDKQMEIPSNLEGRVEGLNRSLCRALDKHTFVCLSMGDFDIERSIAQLTNAGCPYPLHYHATTGETTECQIDAYPLGVRPDTGYEVQELQLVAGDYLVFHSDGIAEAARADEEIFGFERTTETIRQACAEGLSAEGVIDRLISAVKAFAGDAPQGDDMTVVVLKVEA